MNITLDISGFQRDYEKLLSLSKRTSAEVANQTCLNVAGKMLAFLPPYDVEEERAEIKAYLTRQLTQRQKIGKSGMWRPTYKQRGITKHNLQLRHLIIQKARAKQGLPGLYGSAMKVASGAFSSKAQAAAGFLKSTLLQIIIVLNPLCKFKVPFSLTSHIARWSKSAGNSAATVALPGSSTEAALQIQVMLTRTDQDPRAHEIMVNALRQAVESERIEIAAFCERRMLEEMQRELRR